MACSWIFDKCYFQTQETTAAAENHICSKILLLLQSLWISGNPWFAALFPLASHSQGVTITAHQNM